MAAEQHGSREAQLCVLVQILLPFKPEATGRGGGGAESGRDTVSSVWDYPAPFGEGKQTSPQAVCSDSELATGHSLEPEGRAVHRGATAASPQAWQAAQEQPERPLGRALFPRRSALGAVCSCRCTGCRLCTWAGLQSPVSR